MRYLKLFNMLKSALKKSCAMDCNNGRRVTFCKTVQIYGNSIKPEYVADKFHEKMISCESTDIQLFSLKSFLKDIETETFDYSEDPTAFLVHKVVYDEDQLNWHDGFKAKEIENGEVVQDECGSDNEEFVVHQVVLDEDEIPDDYESTGDIKEVSCKEKDSICELSVQNIEQHNKLTESQLLLECDPVQPPSKFQDSSAIILSPPLQELSVDRLICPQTDNWFWNLDISPLSSVHETDSDSNPSSEDTMIMMTTEESMKNEQRIQESLQKFESLKKQSISLQEPKPDENTLSLNTTVETSCSESTESSLHLACVPCESLPSEIHVAFDAIENDTLQEEFVKNELASEKHDQNNVEDPDTLDSLVENVSVPKKLPCDIILPPYREPPFKPWDKSLNAVEIPKDVREWKISIDSTKTTRRPSCNGAPELDRISYPDASFVHNNVITLKNSESQITDEHSSNVSEPCADELEHFVDQCTDRVERIRKRYSINDNMLWTPRRGIRPRFGSSAEILQHSPNGNHLLLSCAANSSTSSSHYSWPYYNPADQQEENHLEKPRSAGLFMNFLDIHREHLKASEQQELSGQFVNDTNSSSVLEPSRPPFHERGTPEGASPPRLSSESLCDSEKSLLPESIVYYSMHV